MARKKGKVKAIYIIGILWILWSIGFPLFKVLSFLALIGVSIAVLGIVLGRSGKNGQDNGEKVQKQNNNANTQANVNKYSSTLRVSSNTSAEEARKAAERRQAEAEAEAVQQSAPQMSDAEKYKIRKRKRTGDSSIDKMIDEEEKAIIEMRRLDESIEDEKVSAQIVHLEEVTTKIVDYVVEHPAKRGQVRRFFSYYLPTSLKLLNSYDRMDETGISGMNIDDAKGSVEELMDKALEAFDKQLDALYADEAMDVKTEIKVMESLMAQEGLTDDF